MAQTTINKLKIVEINGADKLTKELELLANTSKTPIIISEAGLGKTELVKELKETLGFDVFFEVRISGMSSEDFNGIPVKFKNEKNQEVVKFALLDWLQYIQSNPEKKVLVFLDK